MARRIKLNSTAIADVLKRRETHKAVNDLAYEIAKNVRAQGVTVGAFKGKGEIPLPVTVFESTTDRARASVQITHPAGIAEQAKRGVLTKAAAQAGLKVND